MPRARRPGFALLTVFLGLVLGLAGLELGLRIFWDGYYEKVPKAYVAPHASRGWQNRPNARVDYGEPEFSIVVEHNAWGFRSPPVTPEKPDGVFRVLSLGDSMTYGIGVQQDETFSAVLQSLDPRLEVINTGVNGYGTSQELLLLREDGLQFHPDLVLVAFFWNDVENSYLRDFPAFKLADGELIYPERGPEVDLAAPPPPPKRRVSYALRGSYAYRFLSDRLKVLRYIAKDAVGMLDDGTDLRAEDRPAAWELEFALLREIDRLARENGARILIMVIPDQVQIEPDASVVGFGPDDYDVQGRLQEFGEREGIAILDLAPALHAAYQQAGEPIYWKYDRHLKPPGQAAVARTICAEILRLGLLKESGQARD
jgi:hypothetical protein